MVVADPNGLGIIAFWRVNHLCPKLRHSALYLHSVLTDKVPILRRVVVAAQAIFQKIAIDWHHLSHWIWSSPPLELLANDTFGLDGAALAIIVR